MPHASKLLPAFFSDFATASAVGVVKEILVHKGDFVAGSPSHILVVWTLIPCHSRQFPYRENSAERLIHFPARHTSRRA